MSDQVGLRLQVTPDERDRVRVAAALAGYHSIAHLTHDVVLQIAELYSLDMPVDAGARAWYRRLTPERRAWLIERLTNI